MIGRWTSRIFALLVLICFASCQGSTPTKIIDLEKREPIPPPAEAQRGRVLRVAVGSMITPKEGYAYYRKLLDYVGQRLNRPVKFIDRHDYAETNRLIESGDIDVAFVCGGPYVDGHSEFGMELLAAPQMGGKQVYHSYIIVHRDSPIARFEDLRGKTFAFADPMSNSGWLVPTSILAKMHETPQSFFSRYTFTYAHDKSIKAVAQRILDGAAVDSLIWEYLSKTDPELTSRTKRVMKSEPFGIPPIVVRPDLDPELKADLRRVLLNMHKDEQGKQILEGMMVDEFAAIDDSAYDSIRGIKALLSERARPEPTPAMER